MISQAPGGSVLELLRSDMVSNNLRIVAQPTYLDTIVFNDAFSYVVPPCRFQPDSGCCAISLNANYQESQRFYGGLAAQANGATGQKLR